MSPDRVHHASFRLWHMSGGTGTDTPPKGAPMITTETHPRTDDATPPSIAVLAVPIAIAVVTAYAVAIGTSLDVSVSRFGHLLLPVSIPVVAWAMFAFLRNERAGERARSLPLLPSSIAVAALLGFIIFVQFGAIEREDNMQGIPAVEVQR